MKNDIFNKLAQFEGIRYSPYDDATGKEINRISTVSGYATVGIGHKLTKKELSNWSVKGYSLRKPLKKWQVKEIFNSDIKIFTEVVDSDVKVMLTENQRIALISFVFNIGIGAFRKSTLLKKLNAGDYDSVPSELLRWRFATVSGKKKPILLSRRNKEIMIWNDVSTTIVNSKRIKGATIGSIASIGSISSVINQINQLDDSVTELLNNVKVSLYVPIACVILTAGFIIWTKHKDRNHV